MSARKLIGQSTVSPTGEPVLVVSVAQDPSWVIIHVWPDGDPSRVPVKRWVTAKEVAKWIAESME